MSSDYTAPTIPVQFDEQWRTDIRKEFEGRWCKPLREACVRYRTVVEDGRAASVITKVADEDDADVVLVGRRGRVGVAELLLGSVSHELVLHCKRPALVISALASSQAVSPHPEMAFAPRRDDVRNRCSMRGVQPKP